MSYKEKYAIIYWIKKSENEGARMNGHHRNGHHKKEKGNGK